MKLGMKNDGGNYRGRNFNDIQPSKGSYASLDNYARSPYLQKFQLQTFGKNKKFDRESRQQSNKKSVKGVDKQNGQILHLEQKHNKRSLSGFDQYNENTAKKTTKFILPKLQLQESSQNNSWNQKHPGGSISATLEVTKKKRLEPLKTHFKIHSFIKTKAGSNGKSLKINQDIAIVQTKLPFGLKMYCICDGHGVNGHIVSAFIKNNLIKNLTSILKKTVHQPTDIQEIVKTAMKKTNDELLASETNTELSGSTFVGIFIYDEKIYCFNVGDSRAILSSYSNKAWRTKELSSDQKPDREDEKERIIKAGGRIECQKDDKGEPIGPLRVWMKDIQMPGLAMTRSFGDKAGIKAGTNAEPEVTIHPLTFDDKFLIVASDGIWEYIQSEEAANILTPYYMKNQLEVGAERLVKIGIEIWQKLSYSRDDITVIVVGLNPFQH